jgi:hypothetical protein
VWLSSLLLGERERPAAAPAGALEGA